MAVGAMSVSRRAQAAVVDLPRHLRALDRRDPLTRQARSPDRAW
jgi:hypothetical protein